MVWKTAGLGLLLSGLVGLGFGAGSGSVAGLAAAGFGGLATAAQTLAVRLMGPAVGGPVHRQFQRHGLGIGLRLIGVVALPVAVVADRALFPPIPSAFGYLGVLVPLLFLETRLFR